MKSGIFGKIEKIRLRLTDASTHFGGSGVIYIIH